MSRLAERYFDSAFQLPNFGLRAYFSHVREGVDKNYVTPFARGETTEHMLGEWLSHLESIKGEWPTLFEFEEDLSKKVGPMSFMKPLRDRIGDIDNYYDDILLPSEPIDPRAINCVIEEFSRLRGLRVRNQANTILNMKLSTNSGSPFFTKRRRIVEGLADLDAFVSHSDPLRVQQWMKWNADREFTGGKSQWYGNACAVLGWRGQEGGLSADDVKQRVVWMFPFAVNVKELQFYQPFIEQCQRFNLVPAWVSMESVDSRITALFDSKADSDLVVCTDFSRFDQHFNSVMQDAARTIFAAVSDSSVGAWLNEVFPIKYMIPLAYDYGKVRFGAHGMGSGSGGTNADETMSHRALQYEAALRDDAKLNPNSMDLGDDGILSYPGISSERVVDTYKLKGQSVNILKFYESTQDCIYLRRWHHKDYRMNGICVGVYSTCRALGRLRYLERYMDPEVWGPKTVALRQLSILENCKYHPLKEEFVKFCMKRDKYRLGIDIPNFLSNIRYEAAKVTDQMPDFLGYTRTLQGSDILGGIERWWIVNYLKSLG